MTESASRNHRIALALFGVALIAAWFAYRPAMSGAFQLDDVSNLADIQYIETGDDVLDFILEGTAGPAGRPIALWSFALQADQWEHGAAPFLKVNLWIHLLNAVLLALCLVQLATASGVERQKARLVAAAAAGLWVVMPLLASSSLLVVQRMTTLSAFFSLLGLAAYLRARCGLPAAPNRALLGMSASVVLGSVLATLSKESGLLLPVYILVLESTVLARPETVDGRKWQLWKGVFLAFPLVILSAYLVSRLPYSDAEIARRDFNAWERLMTEARVLWTYVFTALIGLTSKLGAVQTPPDISRSILQPLTLIASLSWVALAAGAIAWRRRYPLAALAILWYLAGHMLESTTVPLELYFEHRNYLPIAGPLFAVCAWALTSRFTRTAAAVLAGYFVISTMLLVSFTSLWGQPALATNYWALQHPDSVRAVTGLASQDLVDWGPSTARKILDEFVTAHPEHGYLRIQILNLDCLTKPGADHGNVLGALETELGSVSFTFTAGTMLSQLHSTVSKQACAGVGTGAVRNLADVLLANPRYSVNPVYRQFHHKLLASMARGDGDIEATIRHLNAAIEQVPSSELNMMMVTTLAGAGDFAAANAYIEDALDNAPKHPLRAIAWRRNLQNLREYVAELERYSREASRTTNEDS